MNNPLLPREDAIHRLAMKSACDIPKALLHAPITIESVWDPNAVSRAGAVGLMQLMPATARRYGVYNRHSSQRELAGRPATNIAVIIVGKSHIQGGSNYKGTVKFAGSQGAFDSRTCLGWTHTQLQRQLIERPGLFTQGN